MKDTQLPLFGTNRTGGPEHIGSILDRVLFAIFERAGVGAQPIPQPRP